MNAQQATLLGIGLIDYNTDVAPDTSTGTSSGSGFKIDSWDDITNLFKSSAEVVTAFKNSGVNTGGYGTPPPPPPPGLTTTTKIVIGVAAVGAVGAIVYAVTRKKKKS